MIAGLARLLSIGVPAWISWAGIAALCAAIWSHGYFKATAAAEEKAQALLAATEAAQLANLVNEIRAREAAIAELHERLKRPARVRTIEVTKYVTSENDRACVINNGFVRVHVAAAAGRVPESAGAAGGRD